MLDQRGIQVLFNGLIEIGIDCLGFTFISGRAHGDLVGNHQAGSIGFRDGLRLLLIGFRGNVALEGHHPFVAVFANTHIFESGLIQRLADVVGHVRGFAISRASRQHSGDQ